MKWFRSNIKHGSRLALFALLVQFALTFGHFHWFAAQATPAIQSGLALSPSADPGIAPAPFAADRSGLPIVPANPDSDRSSNDPCAICAVIALASSTLFATPPQLLLPQAIEFVYLVTAAGFVHLNAASAAFQPRAPPVS